MTIHTKEHNKKLQKKKSNKEKEKLEKLNYKIKQ